VGAAAAAAHASALQTFNKVDVARHEFALEWMADFETFATGGPFHSAGGCSWVGLFRHLHSQLTAPDRKCDLCSASDSTLHAAGASIEQVSCGASLRKQRECMVGWLAEDPADVIDDGFVYVSNHLFTKKMIMLSSPAAAVTVPVLVWPSLLPCSVGV